VPLCAAGLWLCLTGLCASAQGGPPATHIYTCVDARGHRLTSDRPIMECIDREQRELSQTGTLRRVIPPAMTAAEREAREAREREAALERVRVRDTIRRDQALITRYPDQAAHDSGREQALAQTATLIHAAEQRIAELSAERQALDRELEFYRKDPAQAPLRLRRAIEDNTRDTRVQRHASANLQEERDRIRARFDEEARRLLPLWEARAGASATER